MGPRHLLTFGACNTACLAPEILVSMDPSPYVVFACKTATFGAELQLSMSPRPHLSFSACKKAWIASELLVSIGPSPHLRILHAKQRLLDQNYKSLWSQTSPVVLCMQNGVICTRMKSLYGFQPSSVLFSCKTVTLGPDLQVCMGSTPHLWFWAHITACLAQELKDYMCSSPQLWFCACKTACLTSVLLVSIGSSPHLWFLNAKQRLLDQINKSLLVPDFICRFLHAKQCD